MLRCEVCTERLSDYQDGEVERAEQDALELHLAGCESCRSALAGLRAVRARTAGLEDRPPDHDLWPGIRARLEAMPREGTAQDVALRAQEPMPRAVPARRRFSFSVPQLAAAGLALSLLSGGMVWLLRPAPARFAAAPVPAPPSVPAAPGGGAAVRFAMDGARPQYDAAVADLERILEEGRGQLDPATIEALEHSLATIDRAIEEARLAVARDTADVYLNNYLADTMKRKLELLRYATTIVRAQS